MGTKTKRPKFVWSDEDKARFREKVNTNLKGFRKRYNPSRCWLWDGALNEKGYGIFRMPWGAQRAHRMAFLFFNDLPRNEIVGVDIHHTCENNHCVNPNHLEAKGGINHDREHAKARARSQRQAGRRFKKK